MKKNDKPKFNYKSAIIVSIVAIIVICIVSVVFRVMSPDALPLNYLGAALSSLIGALITLVLLRGQTDIEEQKGKDIKILEKKIAFFQEYIKDVWKVWENQKITIEEFQDLASKYYQNLMIYLKKDRLEIIGNELSVMGKTIGEDDDKAIAQLRGSIIRIINELSDELELGGQVNEKIMDEHDKIVFPLLFKNKILEEANKVLPVDDILEKGKFEFVQEFRGAPSTEYLCFNFIKYTDCKIVIDGFSDKNDNDNAFILFIDQRLHKFDEFRMSSPGGKYVHRIKTTGYITLLNPIQGDEDTKKSPPINFSNGESMEIYRTKKRGFAKTFAKRINYHFEKTKIVDVDLNILEFLERYYEEL